MTNYTIDRAQDEHGRDRFFVADESGEWVGDPHDTPEGAAQEIAALQLDEFRQRPSNFDLTPADRDEFSRGLGEIDGGGP